jgi:transcriptional regulator with XRE-family HTH domain
MGKSFGAGLASARIRQGLTQSDLGDKMGVSQALISHWENGGSVPSDTNLKAVQEIVGSLSARGANRDSNSIADVGQSTAGAFGAWLAKVRTKKNMSVPQLAKKANVSTVAIYNIEAGKA